MDAKISLGIDHCQYNLYSLSTIILQRIFILYCRYASVSSLYAVYRRPEYYRPAMSVLPKPCTLKDKWVLSNYT